LSQRVSETNDTNSKNLLAVTEATKIYSKAAISASVRASFAERIRVSEIAEREKNSLDLQLG
jgi:hypothetical protein